MSRFPPGVPTDVWGPSGEPVGSGIVLPGRGYPPAAPGCAYAGYVLRATGWRVRDVWWDPPANSSMSIEDEVAWVGEQLAAATEGVSGPVFVVGKSLGTYAARLASERAYPAIWLTPVLTEPVIVDAIRANSARQLLGRRDRGRPVGHRRRGFAGRRRVRRTSARRPRPRPHRPHRRRPLRRGAGRDRARHGQLRRRFTPSEGCNAPERPWIPGRPGIAAPSSVPVLAQRVVGDVGEVGAVALGLGPLERRATSASASSRPTQLAPSTDLPGSSSL